MISYVTKHRLAPNLLYALLITIGLWSFSKINFQLIPTLTIPTINIKVSWPNHDTQEMEKSITIPISKELVKNSAVDEIQATAKANFGLITVSLKDEYPAKEYAPIFDQLLQKIQLPRDASVSILAVEPKEIITRLLIIPHHEHQLNTITQTINNQLRDSNLDSNETLINTQSVIELSLTTQTLLKTHKSFDELASSLSNEFSFGKIGEVGSTQTPIEIHHSTPPTRLDDIQNKTFQIGSELLHLNQLFKIKTVLQENDVFIEYNKKPASEITIQRPKNGDTFEYAQRFNQWLEKAKKQWSDQADLSSFGEQWNYLKDRLNTLLKNGAGGLILVLILLTMFLGSSIAFWVAMGIPAAFISSLFILVLAGGTINAISLFAFIISLGIVVDDAIVVAERYFQLKRENIASPAIKAAKEMFPAVLTSSLTTTSAFLPLLFVGGVSGIFLREIPIVVLCVILTSLIECFLILPGHLSHIKNTSVHPFRQRFANAVAHYQDHVHPVFVTKAIVFRNNSLLTCFAFLIISSSLVYFKHIPFNFFPSIEGNEIFVNLEFSNSTPFEKKQQLLHQLQNHLDQINQTNENKPVVSNIIYYGRNQMQRNSVDQSNLASIRVELTDPSNRSLSNLDILKAWQSYYTPSPFIAKISFFEPKGGPSSEEVTLNIFNDNLALLNQSISELKSMINPLKIVSSYSSSQGNNKTSLQISIKPEAKKMGINEKTVAAQLSTALNGVILYTSNDPLQKKIIQLRLDKRERDMPSTWNQFPVRVNNQLIPLGTLANITTVTQNESIMTINGRRAHQLFINLDPSQGDISSFIRSKVPQLASIMKEKYNTKIAPAGRYKSQQRTLSDMGMGALVAITLIFITLAWLTQSIRLTFCIISLIPFGCAGGLWGHAILGYPVSLLSLFGFFALTGILINDAIILILEYQKLIKKLPPVQAMAQASSHRFRAVLLTSLTTVGGLTPLLFETSLQAQILIPMATTIVFGLIFSTVWVLFALPVFVIKKPKKLPNQFKQL